MSVTIRDDYAGVGWSEGLDLLGRSDVGIEWDASSCATRAACGHATIRADLSGGAPIVDRAWEGYIASPPCQTFSAAGEGGGRSALGRLVFAIHNHDWHPSGLDERTAHALHTARTALNIDARWIALEQVPAVLPVWEAIAFELHRDGWSTWTGVLNAADYGVPQTRKRAILCASRDRVVHRPPPTHAETLGMFGEMPWVSWGDALGVCGTGSRLRGSPRAKATVRDAEKPAPTVLFGKGSMFIEQHTDQLTPVSVAQAACLQSFRSDLPWQGAKSSRYRQIGNAVPPLLAAHIIAMLTGKPVPNIETPRLNTQENP
jgi:DNA (cytosine-5)-methyltransferase 1